MINFSYLFLFLAFFLIPSSIFARTDHIVGDDSGWDLGVDYSSWTIGKTFFVGDNLVFRYQKGLHNVLDVNVTAFAECAAPKNQRPLETGNDVIPLKRPGTRWFICSLGHDCQSGQKLVIFVDNPPSSGGQATPPTPGPALPPPSTAAPPPSVPPPGQNQTTPHLPVPSPSESIPPSHSPTPSLTAPPPSGSVSKSAISGHLGVLAIAVSVLAGIRT